MGLACDVVAAALAACGCAGVLAGCDADAEAPAGVAAALAPAYPTHVRLSERQDRQPGEGMLQCYHRAGDILKQSGWNPGS